MRKKSPKSKVVQIQLEYIFHSSDKPESTETPIKSLDDIGPHQPMLHIHVWQYWVLSSVHVIRYRIILTFVVSRIIQKWAYVTDAKHEIRQVENRCIKKDKLDLFYDFNLTDSFSVYKCFMFKSTILDWLLKCA